MSLCWSTTVIRIFFIPKNQSSEAVDTAAPLPTIFYSLTPSYPEYDTWTIPYFIIYPIIVIDKILL